MTATMPYKHRGTGEKKKKNLAHREKMGNERDNIKIFRRHHK
jgi:hypothetical protein